MRFSLRHALIGTALVAFACWFLTSFDFTLKRQLVFSRISRLQKAAQSPSNDIKSLEKLMDFAESNYQFGACAALEAIGDCGTNVSPFLTRIVRLLESPNRYVSRSAALALADLEDVSLPVRSDIMRIALRGDPYDDTTWYCVEALGRMGEQDCEIIAQLKRRNGYCDGLDISIRRTIAAIGSNCSNHKSIEKVAGPLLVE